MKEPIYILQLRDGDYVSKVTTGKLDTVKLHFEFTKDINEAAPFKESELIGKATLGVQFVSGYTGGRFIPISEANQQTRKDKRNENRSKVGEARVGGGDPGKQER
jgi:hypothetical protein